MNFKTNFTNSRFQQYLDFLQASGTSQSTLDRKLSSLNSFQSFLIKKGYLEKTISSPSPLLRHSEPISSKRFLSRYLLFGTLIAIILGLGYGLYSQTILKAKKELAYTTATNPIRAGRILSFQGRLTDSAGNPIIATTDILFKLYTADLGGTELYTSSVGNSQTVTPDDNGIFSVVIGKSHGTEIPSSVFSENPEVWLEITAGNETMTPRQQIATVGYALNSETLQGLPPSASGLKDTVLVIDHQGNLNLGETSPTIKSTSGIMAIEGQALLLKAADGSGGNITLNPDSNGIIRFLTEGTSPSSGGFIDISNANIAGGNLINSQINNDNRAYNFLSFQNYNIGTTTLSTRFSVNSYGSAYFGAGITTPTITMSTGASNGYILQSDTSGNASWVPAVGIGGTYTASNGINLSGSDFRLGGQLNQNTSIDTSSFNLSFLGTGNVGLGTTNPTQKLDVAGNINLTGTIFSNGTSGTSGQILSSTGTGLSWIDPLSVGNTYGAGSGLTLNGAIFKLGGALTENTNLTVGNTSVLFLGLNGNVGIGTTGPTNKFEVNGDISINTSSNSVQRFKLSGAEIGAIYSLAADNNFYIRSAGELRLQSGGANTRLTINSTGNVGIGTTNPSYKLHVNGSGYFDQALVLNGGGTFGGSYLYTGTNPQIKSNDNIGIDIDSNANGTNNYFSISHDNGTELFRVQENGSVGIGTTNPGYKLDVALHPIAVGVSGTVRFGASDQYSARITSSINGSGVPFATLNGPKDSSGWLAFSTGLSDSERMRITSAGRIGIGTTAPGQMLSVLGNALFGDANWVQSSVSAGTQLAIQGNVGIGITSPSVKLEIATAIGSNALSIGDSSGRDRLAIGFDSDGSNRISSSNLNLNISSYLSGGSGGNINFQTQNNGTAIPLDRMIISQTGYVGIGTTDPTQKLDVVGAARISVGITTPQIQLTNVATGTGTTALFIDATGNLTQRALGSMAFDSGTYDNYQSWNLLTNSTGSTAVTSNSNVNFVNGVGISLVQSGSTITINNSSVGTTYTAGVGLTLSDTNVFSVDYGTGLGLSGNKLINTGLLSLNSLTGNLTLANGTDTTIINVGNTLYVNDTSTLQSITSRGATTTNQLTINYSGAPFILSSGNTSTVTNLSADLLDGRDSTYFLNIGQTGSLPYVNNATDTTLTRSGTGPYTLGLNLGNANTWTGLQTFSNNFAVGSSALITNLNAQYLNGLPSSAFLQVGATGNFITTLTQGVGISITGTGIGRTIALTNTGVTPATYGAGTSIPTFTVDAQGRITSASQTLANFESPLTFNNGLTRTANTISLGGTLNQNTTIGTSSFSLSIGQGNTQALFISAGGNVGVGTTNPGSKLDIIGNIRSNGTITGQIFSDYSDSTYRLDPQNSTTSLIVAGNVGIGTTAPTQKLDINGSLNIGGSMAIGSTQLVANLNSDLLDGYHASSFLSIGATGNLLTDLTAGVGISISGTGIGRTIALTNTGVTPATYGAGTSIPTFTVDAQGRITSASSIALPAGVSYTASNGVTQVGNDFQLDHAYANTWTALQTFSSNFAVGSSALITNLNAQYLNGLASSAFMQIGQTGSLPYVNDATNTTLTRSGTGPYTLGLNLANANTWTGVQTFSNNFAVGSTALISSLNADLLDGNHASAFVGVGQTANFITTLTQGVGISITGTGVGRTIALTNTAVTPGTYGSGTSIPTFTVDAQGRITSAASIALPVDNNTTYTAGLGLTLSNTNVFSLDLASTNTWTGLQTFSNNFNVGSSALITNLNAQYLNGLASSAFMQIGQTGSLPYVNNATDSTLTRSGVGPYTLGLNLGNANTWTALQTFSSNFAVGSSALITNLNSDLLDGYHANNLPYDNYGNWQLQSNGANTTAIGSGTTVNFVNGVGISLVQSGSTITINNSSVGTTYTAGLGLTLSDTNVFSLNLAANNTWTGVQTFSNNFAVGSSALITNLNAQYLNGLPSSAFLQVGATGNFITTLTQGVGISITGTGIGRTIALTNTGVTPATYGAGTSIPTFTVDAQGRITSASSIALPAGVSYTASNGVTQVGNDFQLDHAYANTWTALQTFSNLTIGGTFISVGSTNLVTNLNANYLNGHSDSYFLDLGDTGSFIQSLTNGGAISITGTGVGRTLAVNFNTTNLQLTANQLNTIQNIDVTAQPTFARLGIGSTNSLYALNVGGTTYTNNLYTSGNVGIGTTSPLGQLNIVGTPGSGTRVIAQATGLNTADFADFDFYDSSGNVVGAFRYVPENGGNYGGSNSINFINVLGAPLTFGTSNFVRMTLDSIGNLGLGTTNPLHKLDINGDLYIGTISSISDNNLVLTSNSGVISSLDTTNWDKSTADDLTSLTAGIGITITGTGNSRAIAFDGSQIGNMTFGSGSAFNWTINAGSTQNFINFNNGNFGIGTTTPRTTLEVNGTIAAQKFVDLTGYDTFFIDLANSDYNSSSMQLDRRGSIKWNALYNSGWNTIDNGYASKIESGLDGLLFATSIGSTAASSPITNWNQNLFLAGTGRVGIGTTSPASKFHVSWANSGCGGQCYADAAIFENSANVYLQLMGGTSNEKSINFGNPTNGADGAIKYNQAAVPNGFGFWTNGNIFRMGIDQNGNVGIGGTNPRAALEINKVGINNKLMISDDPESTYFYISNGGSVVSIGASYSTITSSMNFEGDGINFQIGYTNSPRFSIYSGTTETLRLTSDGRLGVGITNPLNVLNIQSTNTPQLGINYSTTPWGPIGASFGVDANGNTTITSVKSGPTTSNGFILIPNSNIGLGTSNPSEGLHISNSKRLRIDNSSGGMEIILAGDNDAGIYHNSSSNPLYVNTAGSPIYLGNSYNGNNLSIVNGNIGIGTTNPLSSGLHIGIGITNSTNWYTDKGTSFLVTNPSSNDVSIKLASSTSHLVYGIGTTSDLFTISSRYSGSDSTKMLTIDSSGNVGIGTASPAAKLDVYTGIGSQYVGYDSQYWSTNNSSYNLRLQTIWDSGINYNFIQKAAGTDYSVLSFYNGKVGIGTTAPGAKLEVFAGALGTSIGNELAVATLKGTTSNADYLNFYLDRESAGTDWQTATWKLQRKVDTTNMAYIGLGNHNSNLIAFGKNTTEYMRIDGSGKVGIGTTSPLTLLHIGSTNAQITLGSGGTMSSMDFTSFLNSTGTYGDISVNAYFNGANWYQRNPNNQSWLISMPSRNDNTGAFDIIGKSAGMGSTASAITWEYLFKLTPNGNVGIGYTTAIPDNKLDVFYSGTSHVAHFKNGSTASTAPVLALQLGATTTSNNYITFLGPTSTAIGRVRPASATSVAYATTGTGDFAEYINGDEATEPGDIIAYHSQFAGKARPGQTLAGIYSTYGTFVAGENLVGNNPNAILLTMSGITQVKVNSSNGPINNGDPITLSSNAIAVGAKAISSGYIVARAMESYSNSDPSQTGLIKAQVSLSFYDPDLFLTDTGEVNVNYNVSDEVLSSLGYSGAKNEIEAGTYTLTDSTGKIVTKISQFASLAAAKINTGLLTAKSIIADNLVAKNIASETIITGDITATTATISGTLTTDKLTANEATISTLYADNIISKDGSFQNIFAEKISSLREEIKNIIVQNQSESTPSAIMADASTWDTSVATDSANLDLANLTISDNLVVGAQLIVTGNTKLDSVSIQNTLTVGQIAINDNIIETTSTDLYIQPSALATIHFLNDRLVLSPDGNVTINGNLNVSGSLIANLLNVKDIQTETLTAEKINVATVSALPNVAIADASTASATATSSATIATNATAGSVTLNTGSTEIIIENSRLTPNSMVYLTPNASTQNQVLYVKNKNDTSFTIAIDQPLDHNVDINWWLIN